MAAAKTGAKAKKRKRSSTTAVTRNVAAARDKIVGGVSGSLNAVLLTRKNIEDVIEDAVKRGRMTQHDAHEVIQGLLSRGARATGDIISDLDRLIGRGEDDITDAGGPSGRPSDNLPITGYDDLSAAKIVERLAGLTPAQLRKVRDYERKHANRKTVLDPIERKLG